MVVNRVSPGIQVTDFDRTASTANALTKFASTVAWLHWGPVGRPVFIGGSEDKLAEIFGPPKDDNFQDWFVAAEFLREASGLYVSRVVADDANNASISSNGNGLTVDYQAVNSKVSSVSINTAGSGYAVGDVVKLVTNPSATFEISSVSSGGVPTGLAIVDNGSEFNASGIGETTTLNTSVQIGTDEMFDAARSTLPSIIAKYPGSAGNIGVAVLRASDYYGTEFVRSFMKAPKSDMLTINPIYGGYVHTIDDAYASDPDLAVLVNDIQISRGTDPGQFSTSTGQIEFHPQNDDFNAVVKTSTFAISNPSLDYSNMYVHTNGSTSDELIDRKAIKNGRVPLGYYDIDTTTNEVIIGTSYERFSGDSVNEIWTIYTATDALDSSLNVIVKVNGVEKTVVAVDPGDDTEVKISPVSGGYSFEFFAPPPTGDGNIEIEWDFPTEVHLVYGVPVGRNAIKLFRNQDEVHVAIFDPITRQLYERYQSLGLVEGELETTGLQRYYVDRLNSSSQYVRISRHVANNFGVHTLQHGSNGTTPDESAYLTALEQFRTDAYGDIYMIDPVRSIELTNGFADVALSRENCVVFTGVPLMLMQDPTSRLDSVIDYCQDIAGSSFVNINMSWQKIYDRYNAKYRWIPLTGTDAGRYASVHQSINDWTTAAGFNRGMYGRALDINWLPSEPERDALYANAINFSVRGPNSSFYLFGQKTHAENENSAFSRMNVRFLAIGVRREFKSLLNFVIFENNTDITRASVRNLLTPSLRRRKSGEGIYDYLLKCDAENNPPEVIDANELIIDAYMQPARTIEKIGLNLVWTQTGISFTEVEF